MRVVIADDNLLVREGLASLLRRGGVEIAAEAASSDELQQAVDAHRPDLALIDIRMPEGDEGLLAAQALRERHPRLGIVLVSEHLEVGTAMQVLAERPERLGYLLKHRVTDVDDFVGALGRVAAGGSALDPEVVSSLLARERTPGLLESLTARERDVLALVAEGRSNKGIGERLAISERAVQKHVTAIFTKFRLPNAEDDNRRILAVLAYLRPTAGAG